MRKQTKIAAVVSAAALLALGASITSFAAVRGTWMLVDGEWYCYDSDGEMYTERFCLSNGKEYYVGIDGMLVRSDWVEDTDGRYFVNSSGQKITNDWRLTTPYDDEEAEEEWYYFGSNGKMTTNKKVVYKNNTYYFDSTGKMLTGWVTYDSDGVATVDESSDFSSGKTFYCDETGARVENAWVYATAPGIEDDDTEAEMYWYWMQGSGKPRTGKGNSIKGQTFLFDNFGRMLTGWVVYTDSVTTEFGGGEGYMEIDGEGDTYDIEFAGGTYYYCAYSEDGELGDGHVQKNRWYKTWKPKESYEEDDDKTRYWYWLDKTGEVYVPSAPDAYAYQYKLKDAKLEDKKEVSITKNTVNSKNYFFNQNGEMVSDFIDIYYVAEEGKSDELKLQEAMYYLGGSNDGAMKTGSQSVKDDNGDVYRFFFGTKTSSGYDHRGVGITGNKSGKLYYKGLLIAANDYKYQLAEVEGRYFIVNASGSIQYSQTEYKESGEVLIDTTKDAIGAEKIFEKDSEQWKNSILADYVDEVKHYTDPEIIDVHSVMP